MCQPQKVILVATTVIARFKYRIIRQIFQIMTYLSFQQPDKRIHPTDDTTSGELLLELPDGRTEGYLFREIEFVIEGKRTARTDGTGCVLKK